MIRQYAGAAPAVGAWTQQSISPNATTVCVTMGDRGSDIYFFYNIYYGWGHIRDYVYMGSYFELYTWDHIWDYIWDYIYGIIYIWDYIWECIWDYIVQGEGRVRVAVLQPAEGGWGLG